jgi:hypothetical protein
VKKNCEGGLSLRQTTGEETIKIRRIGRCVWLERLCGKTAESETLKGETHKMARFGLTEKRGFLHLNSEILFFFFKRPAGKSAQNIKHSRVER